MKTSFFTKFYEPQSRKSWSDETLVFYDVLCHINSHFTMPLGYFCEETFKRWDCSKFFTPASGTTSQKHVFYHVLCHEVNRLFLHQGSENVVFYEVLYNTVQKTSYFYAVSAWTLFSATKSRKHRFSRGFTPHGSENLVFYVGLMHPRYFHNRMSKASFFAGIFATLHNSHCILRGFGADPLFLQQGSRNTVSYELFCNVVQKTS